MIRIRRAGPGDLGGIGTLYPAAFPDENLVPLVLALARESAVLSLVAEDDRGAIVGHLALTRCGVVSDGTEVALVGPLAVLPTLQHRGIGSRLMREGLEQAAAAGSVHACVLGDPAYYGRFGFVPERGIAAPYPLPDAWREAWQGRAIASTGQDLKGTLVVPAPWRDPTLWTE